MTFLCFHNNKPVFDSGINWDKTHLNKTLYIFPPSGLLCSCSRQHHKNIFGYKNKFKINISDDEETEMRE